MQRVSEPAPYHELPTVVRQTRQSDRAVRNKPDAASDACHPRLSESQLFLSAVQRF